MTTRRAFLHASASGLLISQFGAEQRVVDAESRGANHRLGHLLRGELPGDLGDLGTEHTDVVIVGGGIAGLSAAWRLAPLGLSMVQLELESFLGGTSAYGEIGKTPHPWGAHYLPVPNDEARAAMRLLREMGVVRGTDAAGRPMFDGRVLCHAPEERLFYQGAWHKGLVPRDALSDQDLAELDRFADLVQDLKERRGRDGRLVFQIPVALSSKDPEYLALDTRTMEEYLKAEGFHSEFLHWYVAYATRDDFGADPSATSAWAGLHYFSARRQDGPDLTGSHFLVWPEGNGRLVKELAQRSNAERRTGQLVISVRPVAQGVEVQVVDAAKWGIRRIIARGCVLAVPGFIARRLTPLATSLPVRESSPWVVANFHVERPLDPNDTWDSVLYGADGLGYVNARHQLTPPSRETVLTYFRAYGGANAQASRKELLQAPFQQLATEAFRDLFPAHPELRSQTSAVEIMVWGHAMPRPTPGFLGGGEFGTSCSLAPRVAHGHADTSGMALFEESQRAGVLAAEQIASDLGIAAGETWV